MDTIFRKVFKQTCRCIFFSLNFILIFDILFLGFSLMQIDYLIFIKKNLFWPYHKACGIIVPRPGIKPLSPAVDAHALCGFEPPGKSFFEDFNFYVLIIFSFFDSFINLQLESLMKQFDFHVWVWPGAWSILSLLCHGHFLLPPPSPTPSFLSFSFTISLSPNSL